MTLKILKIHPLDNVLIALTDLLKDEKVSWEGEEYELTENIPAKHKFVASRLLPGEEIIMYGVLVGKSQTTIEKGSVIRTENVQHASSAYEVGERKLDWQKPDVSKFLGRTFSGYQREDGKVGTANYWLVIPMVFCENRNIGRLREAFENELGYGKDENEKVLVSKIADFYKQGKNIDEILSTEFNSDLREVKEQRLFPNVDGIKFLTHEGGCGGTRQDAQALCGLLAGYITHPNVAGATVLSLGCQNAQVSMLQEEIKNRDANFSKPLYILEQQVVGKTAEFMAEAVKKTFAGLIYANSLERKPAPLSKLTMGLECGGSDGFSGISSNPAMGYASDLLVTIGGSVILSEFPELCGVEQNLSDRCTTPEMAEKFGRLMKTYNERAKSAGSGFDMNPSPGNIKDGLITDAMKSAGAAKKGGSSPITQVLDYPEMVRHTGLNLLCTPGNDVESTTALVGSGANIVLFSTGLGTPTGNPISPVIKISSNSGMAKKMNDIIDLNTGTVIEGKETVEQAGERMLEYVIKVASGEIDIKAVLNGQNDFIPWKRGVSL